MKTISYLRVSSIDQNTEKNKAEILLLANSKHLGHVDFVEEKISGKIHWKKRKIAEVLDILQSGDNLLVPELSRLGRSMMEIMEMLSIATTKKINVYSVKGNWSLDGTLQSKILAMAFSMASEIERDLISARTREALATRKLQGIKLGRPKGSGKSKLDEFEPEIIGLLKNGSTQRFVAKRYGVTVQALHNWIRKNKIAIK